MTTETETARTFLYWLKLKNLGDTSIVSQNIRDMTTHTDTKLYGDETDLEQVRADLQNFDLKYIYTCKSSETRITTIVCDMSRYYLIDNALNDLSGDITSQIWFHQTPMGLVELVPEDIRKYLDIKTADKIVAHLSKKDKQALEGVLPLDFARATPDEQKDLWKRFMTIPRTENPDTLDLSGLTSLSSRIIIEAGIRYDQIRTIVTNMNNSLFVGGCNWLFYFPNVTTLSVWNTEVQNDNLTNVSKYAPNLTIVEFHQCMPLTGRCLIELVKLPQLTNLVLDNEMCKLQETTFETVITDDEWKQIKSDTITTLFINSGNLTLDFIDFSLKSFKQISNFIMHELVLKKLEKNSRSGHTDHKISFHSSSNINEGFYRYADIKVTDLVRNKIAPAFSESMLRKIRELDPSKADIVNQLM
jgi:hypothetical protein